MRRHKKEMDHQLKRQLEGKDFKKKDSFKTEQSVGGKDLKLKVRRTFGCFMDFQGDCLCWGEREENF